MNYIRKMCILRQVKQGFSGDGKALSGLVKLEQYGKNLAVEVSVINFAPLVSGEYYCLLSDGKGKTEMLSLRGKSLFNLLSDLDVSNGFCAVICYVKNEIVPIAYGINGNGAYDWRSILNATLPPVFPRSAQENAYATSEKQPTESFPLAPDVAPQTPSVSFETQPSPSNVTPTTVIPLTTPEPQSKPYDDETVAAENYYEQEDRPREQDKLSQTRENAHAESATQKPSKEKRSDATENGDADGVLHPFKTDSDGYYASVKGEIDELFKTYPRDKTLQNAFSDSEWVRIKGDSKRPQYLVGVVYSDGKAKYVCYALAAENKDAPPEEIKNVCAFVPCSALLDSEGFFVIFQSAATGECIKPERA